MISYHNEHIAHLKSDTFMFLTNICEMDSYCMIAYPGGYKIYCGSQNMMIFQDGIFMLSTMRSGLLKASLMWS